MAIPEDSDSNFVPDLDLADGASEGFTPIDDGRYDGTGSESASSANTFSFSGYRSGRTSRVPHTPGTTTYDTIEDSPSPRVVRDR